MTDAGNSLAVQQLGLGAFTAVSLGSIPGAAKSLQSCPTLCDPTDPCPWDSAGKNTGVGCHFLLQCMKGKVKVKSLSRVRLLATPWTAAYQAPQSMGFSRPEYWSGLPLPSPSIPGKGTNIPAVVLKPVQFQAWGQPNKNSGLRVTDL